MYVLLHLRVLECSDLIHFCSPRRGIGYFKSMNSQVINVVQSFSSPHISPNPLIVAEDLEEVDGGVVGELVVAKAGEVVEDGVNAEVEEELQDAKAEAHQTRILFEEELGKTRTKLEKETTIESGGTIRR